MVTTMHVGGDMRFYYLLLAVVLTVVTVRVAASFLVAQSRLRQLRSKIWDLSSLSNIEIVESFKKEQARFHHPFRDRILQLLDPDGRTREVVAGLDALSAFAFKYVSTDAAAKTADVWLKAHPQHLQSIGENYANLVARIDGWYRTFDTTILGLLPHSLANWLHDGGILNLIHTLGPKAQTLSDGVTTAHETISTPDGDFSFDTHFPWITAIISASYEVNRLWGGKTNLARALAHVAIDISCVWSGMAIGGVLGGVGLPALLAFFGIPVAGWVVGIAVTVLSLVGAILGGKAGRKIKHAKFEEMCKEYVAEAAKLDELVAEVREQAQSNANSISAQFEEKYRAKNKECQDRFSRDVEDARNNWWDHISCCISQFDPELEGALYSAGREQTAIEARLHGFRSVLAAFSPHGWDLILRRRLLRRSIESLRSELSTWRNTPDKNENDLHLTAERCMKRDPADLMVPCIKRFCARAAHLMDRINVIAQEANRRTENELKQILNEFSEATCALEKWVDLKISAPLAQFQSRDSALIKEADAIGAKVSRAA
jgi:hypothetical protein